jgi:site-specific recombinase XerD
MDAIFEAYLAAQQRRRPSPLTLKAIRHALGQTQRWLDQHDLAASQLTLLGCEEYFDALLERQAVSTVRRHLAYVLAAYRYAVRHELVERDPTADVRLPRLPDHDPATYSNEQLRQLHAAVCNEREELVFFLFAFAGLRLGEVAGLEWRQVGFEHWQLRLAGKGGKLRLVPLHPALNELLREACRPLGTSTFMAALRRRTRATSRPSTTLRPERYGRRRSSTCAAIEVSVSDCEPARRGRRGFTPRRGPARALPACGTAQRRRRQR